MKKHFLLSMLFIIILVINSCKKDTPPDLFKIPITNWSLTKSQILSQETRTLVSNISASDIIYLGYPFTDKGDGALKYSDTEYFSEINYGFYNSNKTLEVVISIYSTTNIKTTSVALQFLNSKYGEYTTQTKAADYTGFVGKIYQFNTDFGIVALEEYSQTTNRIFFTKSQYSGIL
jgi:hypothetical protein